MSEDTTLPGKHEHFWQYEGTQVEEEQCLWPIQHWYKCLVCKEVTGVKP